jgi:hypothetical protein
MINREEIMIASKGRGRKIWTGIIAAMIMLMVLGGCSSLKKNQDGAGEVTAAPAEKGPVPLYLDFGDVLIPHELSADKEASFVFRTPGLSAGVLALKGRVEINSLIKFFENNMAKDNWRAVSSFKSPRSMLLYQKENRWCVISITDKGLNTHVEIWVSPTIGQVEEGLLK